MHDEANYSCTLRGILRVDDARNFPTFKIQAASYTECFFISTSSLESNLFLRILHEVSLGYIMNIPSVMGPFSLMRDRMSWEEERKIPVTHAAQSTICSWEPDHFVQGQGLAWTRRTLNWFCTSTFSCTHPTLMLTMKDQATLMVIFIRLSLGNQKWTMWDLPQLIWAIFPHDRCNSVLFRRVFHY